MSLSNFKFVVFFILICFFSLNNVSASNIINCPCGINDVKCAFSCGDGWSPFTSESGNPLSCKNCGGGKCCIKDDATACPSPSFCSTADLTGTGYVEVGDIDCTVGGDVGSCWIAGTMEGEDECVPIRSACDYTRNPSLDPEYCTEDQYCAYITDGQGWSYWACVDDTEGLCSESCTDQGNCCATFAESCGSGFVPTTGDCPSNTNCYAQTQPCASPSECLEKYNNGCPPDYQIDTTGTCSSQQLCCSKVDGSCVVDGDDCCLSTVGTYFCNSSEVYCNETETPPTCRNPSTCIITGDPCDFSYPCCEGTCVNNLCEYTGGGGTPPPDLIYKGPVIDDLNKLIGPVAKILYYGGLFIGMAFIVYSGYGLMMSGGDPQKTKTSQEHLTAAIVGIMFILLSAALLRVIINNVIGGSI